MPIHDWTRVDAGLFHAFHQSWIVTLARARNAGVLPPDYFALLEQAVQGPIPDVLTLKSSAADDGASDAPSALAVAAAPPRTRLVRRALDQVYVREADRVSVRHRRGELVAVVEIVSPGNKSITAALRTFVEKTSGFITQGVHLLVVDLFPPSKRDPQGIHKAIWDQFVEEDLELPAGKRFTLAAYDAGPEPAAYVEFVAVGDSLPDMPIFLKPNFRVPAPLEASYRTTWDEFFPAPLKRLRENPAGDSREQ
jgi:Protein of unknown function (DUF4058)